LIIHTTGFNVDVRIVQAVKSFKNRRNKFPIEIPKKVKFHHGFRLIFIEEAAKISF